MKNDLTAFDFWGKPVWTGGTDDERAARLRAYEATGMEPEEIGEMKNAWHEAGRRLKMAEYIKREALDKASTIAAANDKDKNRRTWAKAICILHDATAVDAESVVRCKDCIHSEPLACQPAGTLFCNTNIYLSRQMGFAVAGRKRGNTMTIEELKKALVEVSELCMKTKCVACPLHYEEISGIPECPLSDEALIMPPAYWAKNKLQEDAE